MIKSVIGNLLDANVGALVNPINVSGTMGKGIALAFKQKYPAMFSEYRTACLKNQLEIGKMWCWRSDLSPWIINFPTKEHWSNPSKLEWIIKGLKDFQDVVLDKYITSIAICRIGCGNGGLKWAEVKPFLLDTLKVIEHKRSSFEAYIYE